MKLSRYLLIVVLSFVRVIIAQGEESPDTVTVGGIFCLTGEIASGCNAIREGAEIAVDEVNETGGIKGKKLRLDIQDSQYSTKEAHTLARRFASNEAILGVLITGIVETKAAAAPLETAKLTYVTLWDSAPAIEALGDYSFGIGPWLPASYEVSAEFAFSALKLRRAAVVATAAEWSLGVAKGFVEYFERLGGDVSAYEETLPGDTDFRSVLSRVLASKPEVIYAPVTAHLIPFFRQLRQLGYTGPVVTSDNLTDDIIAQGAGVFEGVFQTMVADPESAQVDQLKALYRKKFSREPTMLAFHGWGYDGVRLIAEALRNSDGRRESVRDALLAIKDFPGVGGTISFSPQGSWRMPLKVFEVRGGRLRGVHTSEVADPNSH